MWLIKWIKEYQTMKLELQERRQALRVCESCETLKHQLEIVNHNNRELVAQILKEDPIETPVERNLQPILPKRHVPWSVRRQELEANDRATAQLKRQQAEEIRPTAVDSPQIEELEADVLGATQAKAGI